MRFASVWQLFDRSSTEPAGERLVSLAHAARREIDAAQAQFQEVRDPDLVDHAIYRMRAAERHYVFLLRMAQGGSSKDESGIG